MSRLPQRIVCLTTETVEVLYALGQADRIVGISGYTVRPPEARREKPKVYAFASGDIEKILKVQPDLVLTFSDLQADISRDLIKTGIPVLALNMRSVDDILGMVEMLGRLVGAEAGARNLVADLEARITSARALAAERIARRGSRPRVYFEEWDEPVITAVRWVSELIEIAGGENVFADRASAPLARDRFLTDPLEVVRRDPEVIIGSWCGKHFRPERIATRPGWADIAAVRENRLHEIKSSLILTPGPVAIVEGLPQLLEILDF